MTHDRKPAGDSHMGDAAPTERRARRLQRRALGELKRFIDLFLYLWVLFGLFVLNERIILQQHGINFRAQGFAVINAFILAKVMLVLEDINLSRRFYERPLIVTILRDAALFAVLFILFHIAEEMLIGLYRGETIWAGYPVIGGGGIAGILCVAVILFFALIPFFAFRNFSAALGPGRMKEILFGPAIRSPPRAEAAPSGPTSGVEARLEGGSRAERDL